MPSASSTHGEALRRVKLAINLTLASVDYQVQK